MPSRNLFRHTISGASFVNWSRVIERLAIPAVLMLLLTACGGVPDSIPAGNFERAVVDWEIIFEDEFEGTSLDAGKWNIDTGDGCPDLCDWGNNELQIYNEDNISVANGVLTIEGREELDGSFTSGRINTRSKVDITFGRVEVSARFPGSQGAWPAVRMLPTDEVYGPRPNSGEIDIAEGINIGVDGNTGTRSALHYGMPDPQASSNGSVNDTGVSPDLAFHLYEIEWEKDKIRFYVDGQHFQTQNSDNWYTYYKSDPDGVFDPNGVFRLSPDGEPFDEAFHLLINLAIGGDPVGAPDETTVFPMIMEVDFVRVYQCANANITTGRGCGRADALVEPLEDTDTPFIQSLTLFDDGPEVLEFSLGTETGTNELQVSEFNGNGTVLTNNPNFQDPDDETNTVWHVNIAASGGPGNVFLMSQDLADDPLLDTGFNLTNADLAGQLVFDMLLNSISGTTILAKLDSGFPDVGEVALADPVVGEWQTFAIDIADIVASPGFVDCCGGQGVDLANIINPFVFEVLDGDVDAFIDNIQLTAACKENVCKATARTKGGSTDLIVFDDAVGESWPGGIQASDSGSGFVDSADPNSPNKINWEEKTLEDDPDRGTIVEVLFKDDGSDGVWFITSNPGVVDMSGFVTGAVVFDIRVLDYGTNTSGMTMKIDCQFPCSSNDFNLGVIADGVWETITVPVSQLLSNGPLDLTTVNTGIVVFPRFGDQAGGITFQLDNIRWTLEGDIPPPMLDQIDLPVTFDELLVDYTVTDFGDASTVLGEDPDNADNTVAITTKPGGAAVFAGTTIGNPNFANPIPFTETETSMRVDVRVPVAGIPVRLKVETIDCPTDGSDTTCFAELDAFPMMADQFETLSWDFSVVGIDTTKTFEKASIFFDFGSEGDDAVYFWDNVRFGAPPPPPPAMIALANGGFEIGDFTGWTVNAGDNIVGAPGIGANSGSFAAQLTTTGGGGVAEIRQTFAANPGDEINFSVSMLTEAALPAGASFGLAKIVFKDADGNDLVPESASIGVINTEFPGIESQPFLNDASLVDTWVFSEAQGIAPAGTTEVVFLLLNIDFAGGENPIWFDDAVASLVTGEPELTNAGFESGDLSDWTDNAGNNIVGAPGVGANSGSFAAQLTTTGGGGVAELRQTFPANPGDEINLSVRMLTEAALPAGASFGLAKIVFKDADGNDLVPESATIGVINTEFPGIESQPFLNDASPVDTWVFSEAQGIAPAGTTEVVFLLLNIDFAGGENPIWFDDAEARLINNVLTNAGFEAGDFTDWGGTGDNTVGAPGFGAHSGASAAQLTVTGGGGVAEISQSVGANPGDEINLSVRMLTEAALPAGASFGLAKIVFKDSLGNDLTPESASIGVINTEFPGIESQPFLNDASPVDTWEFSEAQGIAPAGTAEVVFLLLNVDFAGGENPIWFDDAQAIFIAPGARFGARP